MALWILTALLLLLTKRPLAGGLTVDDPQAAAEELFSDYFDWKMSSYPEYASELGYHQHDHLMPEAGAAAAARFGLSCRGFKDRAAGLIAGAAGAVGVKTLHYLRLLEREAEVCEDGMKYKGYNRRN